MLALLENVSVNLEYIPLFQNLSEIEMTRLRSQLRTRRVPANRNIIRMEQPGEMIYIIGQGTVKIQVDQTDGSEVILAILGPGEVVGEMSLIDREDRSANAITMEETTLYWMNRTCFEECLRSMPNLNFNLMQVFTRRLRFANQQLQARSRLDVDGRLAQLLITLAEEYGRREPGYGPDESTLPFRLTQSELASLVGATRVRVNQVLSEYKQRNLISVDPSYRITVRNYAGLAQRCE
ncbi:MAG TPA: Crp/Fnr family transcriptional regulator [Chloroflexia bacterium]|nr:Crp/Fnr family transcriptional regulator [Chloroflexia bacterium]